MGRLKKYIRFVIVILIISVIILTGLMVTDERTIWRFSPGVTSSAPTQEFCSGLIMVAEALDEETWKENSFVAGLLIMGATAKNVNVAAEGTEADSILTQYTQALLKCRLLKLQGDLNFIQYGLIRLPYKTGNTAFMRAVLPYVQKTAILPEGFLSEEFLEEDAQDRSRE